MVTLFVVPTLSLRHDCSHANSSVCQHFSHPNTISHVSACRSSAATLLPPNHNLHRSTACMHAHACMHACVCARVHAHVRVQMKCARLAAVGAQRRLYTKPQLPRHIANEHNSSDFIDHILPGMFQLHDQDLREACPIIFGSGFAKATPILGPHSVGLIEKERERKACHGHDEHHIQN